MFRQVFPRVSRIDYSRVLCFFIVGLILSVQLGCTDNAVIPTRRYPGIFLKGVSSFKTKLPVDGFPAGTQVFVGMTKVDITPPPGLGLQGYGPNGKESRGYRTKLYSRSLVIQDLSGNTLALTTVDDCCVSSIVHRLVAVKTVALTGIGTDSLTVSATHTHAGPGHHFASETLNRGGASLSGYDPNWTEYLVSKISDGVIEAYQKRKPAQAEWVTFPIWGLTRNRSLKAHTRNEVRHEPPFLSPPNLEENFRSIDPTWSMLKVKIWDSDQETWRLKGAYSLFGVHGTLIPSGNELYDSDLHGRVSSYLENWEGNGFIHLFANSASGDVSPDYPLEVRCNDQSCLPVAKKFVAEYSKKMALIVKKKLDEPFKKEKEFKIKPLYKSVDFLNDPTLDLCEHARIGTSGTVGAEDGRTHFYHWNPTGLMEFTWMGFEEGGSAIHQSSSCHSPKRVLFDWIQRFVVDPDGFPRYGEFQVLRLGEMVLGSVPLEITTELSYRIQEGIKKALKEKGEPIHFLDLITMANGYAHYATTKEEYREQHYEGGMTVYGGKEGNAVERILSSLATEVAPGGQVQKIEDFKVYPGNRAYFFPIIQKLQDLDQVNRRLLSISVPGSSSRKCEEAVSNNLNPFQETPITVKWVDAPLGGILPAEGPLVSLEYQDALENWHLFQTDEDESIDIRLVESSRKYTIWELHYFYQADGNWPGKRQRAIRAVLNKRSGLAEVPLKAFQVCQNRGAL